MRVALVHYHVHRLANEPGNRTVMKHFGHMPNLQLLYVAAVLEQLGVEVAYYDLVGMNITEADLQRRLQAFDPTLIGMSVYTSHFHQAISYARLCREAVPRAKMLMGGVHLSLFPHETMRHAPIVDYGCVGEAEMMLPEFIRRLQHHESLEGTPGLIWRRGEEVLFQGPAPLNLDLDSCPFPARHLIPNQVYFNFISTRQNYTIFNSSRGCPFTCIFCEAAHSRWRGRSPENIHAEFEQCHETFGIREIDMFDSSFTVRKERVLQLCHLLIQSGLNKRVIWNVRSTINAVNEEMLEALREAGCYRIFYGIESGNEAILKKLRKPVRLERTRQILKKTREMKISTFGYFLIGAPGDTRETVRQTIDFAKSLPLDFAIFNSLTAYPHTELYEKHYLPFVEQDFWADYLTHPKPVETFMGRPWTELPDAEIRLLAHSAMNEFYFRPMQIWRALRSVRSWHQLKRYLLAGLDMIWSYWRNLRQLRLIPALPALRRWLRRRGRRQKAGPTGPGSPAGPG